MDAGELLEGAYSESSADRKRQRQSDCSDDDKKAKDRERAKRGMALLRKNWKLAKEEQEAEIQKSASFGGAREILVEM